MSKIIRKMMAQDLVKKLEKINSFVIFSYGHLTGEQNYMLRSKLRSQNMFVKAVKNTIAGVAIKQLFNKDVSAIMKGSMAIAYGGKTPIDAAKALLEFAKKTKLIKVHGGYLDGMLLNDKQVDELSKTPPKEVLLANLAASFESPFQQILGCVNAAMQGLPNAFNAQIAKLEKN